MNMNSTWTLWIIGFFFCLSGLYLFYRDAFEEDKKVLQPILVMVAGVVLIGLGTAKHLHLL